MLIIADELYPMVRKSEFKIKTDKNYWEAVTGGGF